MSLGVKGLKLINFQEKPFRQFLGKLGKKASKKTGSLLNPCR